MAFTLRSSLGGDSIVVDGHVVDTPSGAQTTLYSDDGSFVQFVLDASGMNALRSVDWAPGQPDLDTLITGDGNDVIVWDASTTARFDFDNLDRARLAADPDRIVEIFDLAAGNDILNLTFRDTADNPGPYGFDVTAFGGSGNDWLAGGSGNDLLAGGADADWLFGGWGSDSLIAETGAVAVDGDYIVGFEGGDEGDQVTIALGAGDQLVRDYFDGGTRYDPDGILPDLDSDTLYLQMPEGAPGSRNVLTLSAQAAFAPQIFGIEVIVASAGADIINLTWYGDDVDTQFGPFPEAYQSAITIQAGDGADLVFAGDGSDVIVGDVLGGVAGFSDTLFGGRGDDTIFGDSDGLGLGGDDTIFGGYGGDTVFGGDGNDILVDRDDADLFGGAGSDVLLLHFANRNSGRADGGSDDPTDGDDRVVITGTYDLAESELGYGNDTYISLAVEGGEVGTGHRVDLVFGGAGADIVSVWYGDDMIDGGEGDDALWGGDGGDTIYGGPGSDFLYSGDGDGDYLYGGAGIDYYYWSRYDGFGDQIFDEYRDTETAGQAVNGLLVFPGFDELGIMRPGDGVFEADGLITDWQEGGDDKVYVVDQDGDGPGTLWFLQIVDETGGGFGSYVEFDQRDISVIGLWNHEAAPGTPVVTQYVWDGTTYSLV